MIQEYIQKKGWKVLECVEIQSGIQYQCQVGTEILRINEYSTGKVLVQGKKDGKKDIVQAEVNALLGASKPIEKQEDGFNFSGESRVGIDEVGKGDFFGPLVICAAVIDKDCEQKLYDAGVQDSKKMTDKKILQIYEAWKDTITYEVLILHPEEYNRIYNEKCNLNFVLAWAHATVLEKILEKCNVGLAISDQFSKNKSLLEKQLMKKSQKICLVQETKAERDLAVAIASVFARACFLIAWDEMEETYQMNFPKGASMVKESARIFLQKWGRSALRHVAKVHFKITNEL
ncbi:MAG TPA: ribonuclease HIII [Planctomycetota bacterium]|nr:ribonuclease HIII [Planctomycetota bacterium]HRU52455.1 ribonuclease HIII [Planctomycetota bacterium]